MDRDTSEKLTTLAVGGKAAGQSLTGTYGVAKFHIQQPLNFDYGVAIPDEILTIGYEVYREMALRWRREDKSFDELRFWVHVDTIKDEFALMKELASGYRPTFQDNTAK